MKKNRLKVNLMIDTEADFYYLIPSPHFSSLGMIKWRLNKIAAKFYRYPQPSRIGIINIIKTLKNFNQKATYSIVGHLFLKSCRGFRHFMEEKPKSEWYKPKIGRDWYYWDHGGNYKTHPGRYLGDILEKERNNKLFEFGIHAFSHEAMTLESPETIDSIISSAIKSANSIGISPKSCAFPFEMTSDVNDPERVFNSVRKHGLKKVFYSGQDDGLKIKRYMDIKNPINENGLEKIWISSYFEGTSSKRYMKKIMREILKNREKDATYCLVTHDYTHKNTLNLKAILKFLKSEGFF